MLELSPDQYDVAEKAHDWRSNLPSGATQCLTMGGYAGTGKSTLVALFACEWPNPATVALAGKAAHVLRSKGIDAQTAHSLIYVPWEDDYGRVRFRKRKYLECQTIIVDEASMIDEFVYRDLLSFGMPVLFVGDHGQLEPIGANPRLMIDPKLKLEKIHRQAAENPILRLATAFREGRPVPKWEDPQGRLSIRPRSAFERLISPDTQIICGFNATRHRINARVRALLGYSGLVEVGEKLIVVRNNKEWTIFNGQQVSVLDVRREKRATVDLTIRTDDGRTINLSCQKEQFGHDLLKDFKSNEVALMDYGYCLTAHKSQGSEWDNVLILEEIASAWNPRRWRYTVATRAKERLVYCG